MSARALIRRGRRMAERLMIDECVILEPSTLGPLDPETGQREVIPGAVVYSGRCKIQNQRLRYPSEPDSGQHVWTLGPTEVHVPVDGTAAVVSDCIVEVTGSHDPANVGREMRVRIGDRKTLQTSIRLLVEEVTA